VSRERGVTTPRLAPALGAVATGVLLVLVFPKWDLGWLAWIALVPLLLAIRHAAPGRAFRLGALAGLVAYGAMMEWVRLFGLPAWIMLTLAMAVMLGLFAGATSLLAGRYARQRLSAWLWIVPVTWTAVEFLRSVGPLGFPWALLGLTQHSATSILPIAAVAGVFGLGGVMALANAAFAALVEDAVRRGRLSTAATAALMIVGLVVGAASLWPRPPVAGTRVVAAIQPNVAPQAKGDLSLASALVDGLVRQTEEARDQGAEIIVYPETAVPPNLSTSAWVRLRMARAAGGGVVVAGAFLPGPQNGVLVLDSEARTLGRYAKRRLVPFGEAGVHPGVSAGVVTTPAGTLALAVCYESAFSFLIRSQVAQGADLVAILTNDGWFGTSAGPAQHAAHSVLRAVESGRSVVRAANTGTSMLIRPDGVVVAEQPLDTIGVVAAALPVGGPPTAYVRWGWLLAPLAAGAWVAAAAPIALAAVGRNPAAAGRLAAAVVVPGAVFAAGRIIAADAEVPPVLVSLLVLALCAVLARGSLLAWRRVWLSAGLSLLVTSLLIAAMRAAYAQYGFSTALWPADGHWMPLVAWYVLYGVAVEAWLRGAVFAPALDLGGWPLAVGLSTFLGVVLAVGLVQEVVFWHLLTGIAFGAIRIWTRDAVGLGPARGLGDAVVQGLAGLR
jgi:apolipoprotein N-acyltransferase